MAFDERLAARIREVLAERPSVVEKKMFGGLTFMVAGHMACGVVGADLMVRVGPDAHEAALQRKHARAMDFTGRSLKGMVYVGADGLKSKKALAGWVGKGVDFAQALPPKKPKKKKS